MRFTSLIVELVRSRPVLVFWLVVLAQAGLWLIIPLLFYASPPGEIATVLAVGREYVIGPGSGPPLAYWLADVAFRVAGNSLGGVYVLAQLCFVLTFWVLFRLARTMVGPRHAVLAILLTAAITAFSFPGVEFGPDILALPLWALVLLNAWRIIGQGRRDAWFTLSINSGLLLLTTDAALLWLALLAGFAVSTRRARRMLASLDPLFALIVVVVLVLPYGICLFRAGSLSSWTPPMLVDLSVLMLRWVELLGLLALTLLGVTVLLIVNSRRLASTADDAPIIYRPPMDPLARRFVFYFLLAPMLAASLLSAFLSTGGLLGGAGAAMLMGGLAPIVAANDLIRIRRQGSLRVLWLWIMAAPALLVAAVSLIQPWLFPSEIRTMLPAFAIGEFFGDSFQRRTGQPLRAVAGDPQLATLIAFAAPTRPHWLLDSEPERTRWITPADFVAGGGLLVWRALDAAGTPPPELVRRFPALVPEAPRAFQRMIDGRQPPLRIGWAILRPGQSAR